MSLTLTALAAFWRNELGFYELLVAKKREVKWLRLSQDQSQNVEVSIAS